MPTLKRATKKLQDAGFDLEVHKGIYGPYLYDPKLKKQRGKVYDSVEAAIEAAHQGERPTPIED